jgi:hypothetical protein
MTKTHLLVLICSLFFNSALWACSFMPDNYELNFCMINADIAQRPDLSFLNYSTHWYNYCDCEGEENLLQNCAEWQKYLGKKIRTQDIITILESTAPDDFLQAYRTKNWEPFKDNTFVKALLKKNEVLQYMALAKKVEAQTQIRDNPWGDNKNKEDTIVQSQIIREIETKLNCITDTFLQQRYACQFIRAQFWQNHFEQIIDTYNVFLKDKTTVAQALVLPKVITSYYVSGKEVAINEYLFEMFEQKNSKKSLAFEHLMSITDLYKPKNQHQKAILQAVKTFRNPAPALAQLETLVQIEPNSQYLPLLLVREIQKLEGWIFSPEILGMIPTHIGKKMDFYDMPYKKFINYTQKNLEKDKKYLHRFRQFVETLPNESMSPNLFHILAAYTCIMDNDFAAAQKHLQQTSNEMPAIQLKQRKMMQIVVLAHLEPLRSLSTRQKLAQLLQALPLMPLPVRPIEYGTEVSNCAEKYDNRSELYRYLSRHFQKQGDLLVAGLLEQKIVNNRLTHFEQSDYYQKIRFWDNYGTMADVDTLLMFKHKKNKTPFEQWLTPAKWANDYVYLDLKGTMAFRQDDFKIAYETFKKIPRNFWNTTYDFAECLNTPSLTYNPQFDTLTVHKQYPVDKTAWVKEAYDIQERLKTAQGTQRAKLCLQMGNVIYNTSINKRCWMMTSYGWHYFEPSGNILNQCCYQPETKINYQTIDKSQKYYSETLKNAGKDQEIAAQACLMLHICKNKDLYDDQIYYYGDDEKPKFNKTYLNILRKKYANTQTFAYLRSTCPDLLHH